MTTHSNNMNPGLTALMFNTYQRKILGLLLLHPDQRYHVREIARLTGTAAGTLHKELSRLANAGLLSKQAVGHQVEYSANTACIIYEELRSILRKTSGLADVLAQALAPLSSSIHNASVYGSVARGTENSYSDIDLLVIGKVDFASLVKALYPVQEVLGREINPKLYSLEEWQAQHDKDVFMKTLIQQPRLHVMGQPL